MAVGISAVLSCGHAVGEGDGKGVEGWLPPHGPSFLTGALGVQASGDQVERFHRGLLVREMATGANGTPVTGVQALDRVRAAKDLADLDVVEPVAESLVRLA